MDLPQNLRSLQALLTLAEAAKILKVSKTKLYHERKAGRINVVTIGVRCVRVTEAEVKRYVRAASLNSRRSYGPPAPKPWGHAQGAQPTAPAPVGEATR